MTQITSLPIPGRVNDASLHSTEAPSHGSGCHFVVGEENRLVRQAANAWLHGLCQEYSPWVVIGGTGTGKSHLARGLAARLANRNRQHQHRRLARNHHIVIVSGKDWCRQFGAATHQHQLSSFRARFGGAELLVLDGLDDLANAPAAQAELAQTLDRVHAAGGRVLLTCCQPFDTYRCVSSRLLSRLSSGLTCQLLPPALETRMALIQTFAAALRIRVTDTAAQLLATEHADSVLDLLQVVQELAAKYEVVDPASCEKFRQSRLRSLPSLQEILVATARHFDLSVAELRSATRKRQHVHARGIAIHLARTLTQDSLQTIGAALGGRDHTTILHQSRKIAQLVEQDPEIVQSLNAIRLRLTAATKKHAEKQHSNS